MAVYAENQAEYAEVSSTLCRSGQPSPSPYATATLVGNSKIISNDAQRFNNMFYTSDVYPPNTNAVQHNQGNNNNGNYNRSIHSEAYGGKVNIVENRMAHTMMFNHNNNDGSNKRNRLRLVKPQNFRINLGSQGEQLYVKVGDLSEGQQMQPQMHSYTWNPQLQNFNIYENHLHRQEQMQHGANAQETDTKTINCD